MMAAVETKLCS